MKKTHTLLFSLFLFIFNGHIYAQCDMNEVTINTITGNWAEEMSWVLYNNNNIVVGEFQGEGGFNNTEYIQEFCLESGCYIIEALDSWGDGWNGGEINIQIPTGVPGESVVDVYSLTGDSDLGYYGFDLLSIEVCEFNIFGCTNQSAVNYNEFATEDDSSCMFMEQFNVTGYSNPREYLFYKPEYLPAQAPLVFVVHGYSGSALDIMNYSGFENLADEHGFAICYPQGSIDSEGNTFFNVGYAINESDTVDDVKFFQELATHLQESHNLSVENTFSTGMSNGGDMCYKLACEASETFSAFGSVAGSMINGQELDCNPSSFSSIIEIHGTNDDVTYYQGESDNSYWGSYLGVNEIISFWVDNNSCSPTESYYLPNTSITDGSQVYTEKYYSNSTNTAIWLFKVEGGGHDWPGVWGNMDIDASEEIWNFFQLVIDQGLNVLDPVNEKTPTILYSIDVLGRKVIRGTRGFTIDIFDDGSAIKRISLNEN